MRRSTEAVTSAEARRSSAGKPSAEMPGTQTSSVSASLNSPKRRSSARSTADGAPERERATPGSVSHDGGGRRGLVGAAGGAERALHQVEEQEQHHRDRE